MTAAPNRPDVGEAMYVADEIREYIRQDLMPTTQTMERWADTLARLSPPAPIGDVVRVAAIIREAAEVLEAVGVSGVDLPANWRWPLADELSGIAATLAQPHDTPPANRGDAPRVGDFVATFRCEDKGIVGTKPAKIHSVNQHDDGVIEVVIDHWPQQETRSAITHCHSCGCDWLDNGLNPVGCPYCKLYEEMDRRDHWAGVRTLSHIGTCGER